MKTLVQARDICKSFGALRALDHVSLNFGGGEITGLLGPNGAGKTTLLRIISSLMRPDSGEALFDGHRVSPSDAFRMGYMPEERGLYSQMGVGEQAMYFARLKGMGRAEAASSLKALFEKFGLSSCWKSRPGELSKGMARKVQFIISVAHRPEFLILDEPFSGLDPLNAASLRDEITALKQEGTGIVLSTHDMSSVESLCSKVAFLGGSRLIAQGDVDGMKGRFVHPDGTLPDMNEVFIKLSQEGK